VRLWNVSSSMPRWREKSVNSPISGSPIVPVPTMCTILFFPSMPRGPFAQKGGRLCRIARAPTRRVLLRSFGASEDEDAGGADYNRRVAAGTVHPMTIAGPAGAIEALWKEPEGERRGSAVVAHAHPLQGGTMHFKVVFRIARALSRAGF